MSNGLNLLLKDEVEERVKEKLKSGYMLFAGDTEAINNLEHIVYPPGTPKNKLFELIVHPSEIGLSFFLGKKTGELKKQFIDSGLLDYDKTLALIYHKKIDETDTKMVFITEQLLRKPERTLDDAINDFVKAMI